MPRSLRVVRVAVTVLSVAFVAALAAGLLDLVPARIGYSLGGRPVPREEWLQLAAPVFGTSAAWFGAAAVGLWRERPWARICIIGAFCSVVAFALIGIADGSLPPGLGVRAVAQAAIFGAVSEIYLFHTAKVSAYFDALRHRR